MSNLASLNARARLIFRQIVESYLETGAGDIVEIQATAEGVAFDEAAFMELMRLARQSIEELVAMQKAAVEQ